ncbi:MAG: ArsS family sensor histidine kinase [Epsilonproteobacteria bacterium]|nr:ArsS family sensor histidine kinase [Campylobacterota bacterium]
MSKYLKLHSLFFTITLFFIVSLAALLSGFYFLYDMDQNRFKEYQQKRYQQVIHTVHTKTLHHRLNEQNDQQSFAIFDFKLITNLAKIKSIIDNPKIKYIKSEGNVDFFESKTERYLLIISPVSYILLHDIMTKTVDDQNTILIFTLLTILFILLYLLTIKKIYPIKTLYHDIQRLGEGDYNIRYATDKKDEISQLANAFEKTAKRLKNYKESRNVFIRNIMHELKTPLAKGKFLMELPHNEYNKTKMREVFYRLENLINEFALVESLITTENTLQIKKYYLSDILDNAIDILMCDDNHVLKDIDEQMMIVADFKLLSIALKNLIDNAIKYSPEKKAYITTQNSDTIMIKNRGEKLPLSFEKYCDPFFQHQDKNSGFGLGLYIVKHILDAHHYQMAYRYQDKYHIITIKPLDSAKG